MSRSRTLTALLAGATACAALLASPAAQGAVDSGTGSIAKPNSQPPSFEEFEAATHRDPLGQYIVNGDEALRTTEELRAFYDRMVSSGDTSSQSLIVNTTGGRDDKWSATQARNLTYCVSNNFGTRKSTVVNAMAAGAALWENASSGINFVYSSANDASCTTSNYNVVFSVEPVQTSQYIARAFFPSSPKSGRNVLVDDSLTTSGWSPANILGHELGHTLGFRHEHTRPEAGGVCFEDNNWRPLTGYDSASIMHYPQCNGSSDDLSFSYTDAQGVRSLYGS
ncbi:matrixin family metalloprotease [Nocardioides litoris]|uniref:matrixin family metalloprotease n=1 Tax=Nocardioides litoris TaxID=1926648 RepID=UPI0011249362|nr:M57 family metalloprotease [Nocardioides litoris]